MPKDDLISRAAALNALLMSKDYRDAHDALEQLPAVDAAPVRHGRWVEETDRENHWHCSECGVVVGIVAKYAPYCYKCGAAMKMDADEPTCGPDYCEIEGEQHD